jgi:hypothetical protein
MARRRVGDLDELLERWARWCDSPSDACSGGSGGSMLARLIDTRGDLMFGGGGGPSGPVDTIETNIEMAVVSLGAQNQMAADVLRLECVAGWWQVTARRKIRGYDPRGLGQLQNALALGVSVRTYRRRLAEAREYVAQRLKVKA